MTALLLSLHLATAATGSVPLQGQLTDATGQVLNGPTAVVFRVYTHATTGAASFTEPVTVNVQHGLFGHALGASASLNLDLFQSETWISVEVGGQESARSPVGWVPRAAFAARADTLDGHDSAAFRMSAQPVPWSDVSGVPAGDGLRLTGGALAVDASVRRTNGRINWSELDGIPTDLADGDAAGGTYTAGAGLALSASQFSLAPTIFTPPAYTSLSELPPAASSTGGVVFIGGAAKKLYYSDGSSWLPVDTGGTFSNVASFTYTGAAQTWTVPNGITQLRVHLWGGGGAGKQGTDHSYNYSGVGGGGGYATAVMTVTPGEVLTLIVGGGGLSNGTGGWSTSGAGGSAGGNGGGSPRKGGGGGGGTSVQRGTSILVLAGGGGGGGNGGGGAGGGASTGNTVQTAYPTNGCPAGAHYGGAGGTQLAAGLGGLCSDCDGTTRGGAGSNGNGGTGQSAGHNYPTGGGGGGYYGGGGGGSDSTGGGCNISDIGGGGGGGSGYIASSVTGGTLTPGTDGTSTMSAGTPGVAAQNGNQRYVAGIGNGGAAATNGGNGLIAIEY